MFDENVWAFYIKNFMKIDSFCLIKLLTQMIGYHFYLSILNSIEISSKFNLNQPTNSVFW